MTRAQAAVAAAFCLTASIAGAQDVTSTVTLVPAHATRWDATAHVTWLGERRPADQLVQWDRWFGVASGGGTLGYYWTSHLKVEFDLSTSNEGEDYSVQIISLPGVATPLFVERDRTIRFTTGSAGLSRQFFENAWFHPFVNGGLELVREHQHIETAPPPVPPRGVNVSPAIEHDTLVRYSARPYLGTGFKVYLSDHAFIRTDIRTSWSRDGVAALGWRSGVGVDF